MRLRIDFEYNIEYVLARRRTTEYALAQANVEVEIEEAPAGSARLVFEAGTRKHDDLTFGVVNCIPDGRGERPAKFYEIEGKLYREHCRLEDLARLTREADHTSPFLVGPKGNPGVVSIVQQGYLHDSSGKAEYFTRDSIVEKVIKDHYSDRWNPRAVPESGFFRTYRDDEGRSRVPLIHERASELLILDGCVLAPASEPVIAFHHVNTDTHHTALVVAEISDGAWSRFGVGVHHALHRGSSSTFALDDVEGAKALARMSGMKLDCLDMTDIRTAPNKEIKFDPSHGFRRHAQSLALELARSAAFMSPEAVGTFVALRTAVRNSPSWTTRPLLDATMAVNEALRKPDAIRKPVDHKPNTPTEYDYVGAATTSTLRESEWHVERLLSTPAGYNLLATPSEPPSVEGTYQAAQVSSAFDREVMLDAMRSTARFPEPSPGDVLIAVETTQKGAALTNAQHAGLFLFDADGNLLHCVGRGDSLPPSQAGELARTHAARVISAAVGLPREEGLDEDDLAALAMD